MAPNRRFSKNLCVLALIGALHACSGGKKDPPGREQVLALLNEEASSLKAEGEADVNPALGVQITWHMRGVDVREQPNNEAEPWAGTIKFEIESKTPDLDGTATDRFEEQYDYVWDLEREAWQMR